MTRRRDAQGPLNTRRAAREFAFRVLFESAQGGQPIPETLERALREARDGDEAYAALGEDALIFGRSLVEGYAAHAENVDDVLRRTIQGWSFGQLAQTDLNVMRLATFELLHTDQPHGVVIESAVRLARRFGGDDSGRFVNGVLGGLARTLPPREERSADGEADAGEGGEDA
ncbi:transcription antitermination factor NusB [Deinococcus pimensis]|uniref:transcription antitermination factor NusB n=1 Tax=Deinococcus pimensis TaxID=309888 RepID=UPI00048982AF|nr:transcription antitermination factor NusB [Deinococcus pimensis]